MTGQEQIAQLEKQVEALREELARVNPQPKRPEPTPVDDILAKALEMRNGDAEAAADLFWIWVQNSSEIRDSLRPLIREAIQRRLAEKVKA